MLNTNKQTKILTSHIVFDFDFDRILQQKFQTFGARSTAII